MEEDMGVIIEPLVDAISNLIVGDVYVDFKNSEAVSSVQNILNAMANLAGLARSIGAVSNSGKIFSVFQQTCDNVESGISSANSAIERLVIDPSNSSLYNSVFLPSLQSLIQNIGEMLKVHAQQFVSRVSSSADDAKNHIRTAAAAALANPSPDVSLLMSSAVAAKSSVLSLSKAAAEAAENTDNDQRKKLINDSRTDLSEILPEFLLAAQNAINSPNDPNSKKLFIRSQRSAIAAVDDVVDSVLMTFRDKVNTLSKKTERQILYNTEDVAASLENFNATSNAENAKALVLDIGKTVQLFQAASKESSDPEQALLLSQAAEELRLNAQKTIVAAKTKDSDPANFEKANNDVLRNLQQARHTVTKKDGWGLSSDIEDRVLAATTETALADKAVTDNPNAENAKRLNAAAAETVQALNAAKNESKDRHQRAQITSAAEEIQLLVPQIQKASIAAKNNPNDAKAQAVIAKLNDELLHQLKEARRAVCGKDERPIDEGLRLRVLEETSRVDRAANKAGTDAKAGNVSAISSDSAELLKSASTAQKGLYEAADSSSDPVQKVKLLQAGDSITSQANNLAAASAAAAANPNDQLAIDKLSQAHDNLSQTVKKAQNAVNNQSLADPLPEYYVGKIVDGVNDTAHEAHAVQGHIKSGQPVEYTAKLIQGVKSGGAKTVSCVYEAAAESADPKQRALLMEKADFLQAKINDFVPIAEAASKAPKDSAKQAELAKTTDELMFALNEVRHATGRASAEDSQLSKTTVDQILNTTEQHARAIESLRSIALNPSTKGEEVSASVGKVKAASGETINAIEKAIQESKDPVQRARLIQGKKKIPKDVEKLEEAGNAVAADPTNQQKRKLIGQLCDDSLETLREVRSAATGKEEGRLVSRETEYNIMRSTADLIRAANRIENSVIQAGISKDEKAASLEHLNDATHQANSAILAAAAEMPNAEKRAKLMTLADQMRVESAQLEKAGRVAQSNPNDSKAKVELEAAKKSLVGTVDEVCKQVRGKTVSKETEDAVLSSTDEVAASVNECKRAANADAPPQADVVAIARLRKAIGNAERDTDRAIAETIDPTWKAALTGARSKLKPSSERLAAATERAAKNKNDAAAQLELQNASEDVLNVLRDIRHATTAHKPSEDGLKTGSISDEAVSRALKAADKQAATGYKVAQQARTGNKSETDKLIAKLVADTEGMVQAVNGAAAEAAPNSTQRQRIIEASEKAAASSKTLQAAAAAVSTKNNDYNSTAALARALDQHDRNLREVRKAVSGDALESITLSDDTQRHVKTACADNRAAVHRIVKAAGPQGSNEELKVSTAMLNDATKANVEALYGAASEASNIVQKQKLLAAAEKLQVQSDNLAKAAAAVRSNPNNAAAQDELERAKQAMLTTLDEVEEVATTRDLDNDALSGLKLEEAAALNESFLDKARKGQVGNNDLVAAAAEAAQQALQLCEMARNVAETESKPEKKKAILDAADKTEHSAEELLNAMRVAAANPHDVSAAKRLDEAYLQLNTNVQNMVGLCYSEAELVESGLADALKQMQSAMQIKDDALGNSGEGAAADKAETLGEALLEFMKTKFLRSTPANSKDYVKWAKEAAEDCEKFLKELDAFIAKCDDPVYKEQLKKLRRTIKDRSIQLKILATTKANSSDAEEARAALQAASQNLTASISEALSTMAAASLRNRFKKAVNTAVALTKAVKGFKGLLKKK